MHVIVSKGVACETMHVVTGFWPQVEIFQSPVGAAFSIFWNQSLSQFR